MADLDAETRNYPRDPAGFAFCLNAVCALLEDYAKDEDASVIKKHMDHSAATRIAKRLRIEAARLG